MRVLLSNIDVGWMHDGQSRVEDVIIEHGKLLPASSEYDLSLNAQGLVLSRAFHDHHCHVRATVARAFSLDVGPDVVTSPDLFTAAVRQRISETPHNEWIRISGYHESHCGYLDKARLDALSMNHSIRVEHASGAMWVVNSVGLEELTMLGMSNSFMEFDADGEPNGQLFRADSWMARLPRQSMSAHHLGQQWLEQGVAGVTETTPGLGDRELADFDTWVGESGLSQRIVCMADADTDYQPVNFFLGPMKVVLDDVSLPDIGSLADVIIQAHRKERNIAVHCVTQVQAVVALSAFELAGVVVGDRVEHGAVLDADLVAWISRLGLQVVTQPGFIAERGDRYIEEAGFDEASRWWPLGSLLSAGISVALSSDAPYSSRDPVDIMRAASTRRTRSGIVLGDQECIAPWVAARLLSADALSGEARTDADWCLLELGDRAVPERVAWTLMAGREAPVEIS